LDSDISFEVLVNGVSVGMAGQLSDAIAKKMDFDTSVFCAELDMAVLLSQSQSRRIFQPLPIYPAAPRDLAMIVASSVKAGDLLAAIKQTAGELAESAGIFDIYTGKQIEKGKKSVAISVTYRSATGSLSGEAVDAAQKNVIEMLQRDFAAVIRDK
jgi:phenylalanyl-tRNA synthetase beta chain